MNDELRRSLDRAAGEDPQIDLTESAWTGGRVVRRRRHAAQAVGGVAAAAVLAGAFALGGGVLSEPNAYDGPARPTVDDTATRTAATITTSEPTSERASEETSEQVTTWETSQVPSQEPPADTRPEQVAPVPTTTPVQEPSTPSPTEPTQEPPTATQTVPAGPGGDGVLALTADSVDGLPLDGPAADLVDALTAELGEPSFTMPGAVVDCSGATNADLYAWDVLQLTARDVGLTWTVHAGDRPASLDLPGSLKLGMTEQALRAAETVVAEPTSGGGWPVLVLQSGVAVDLGEGDVVVAVSSTWTPPC
ncbi:hypothetical protein [Ornithinimicrobium pekingense]|uniref:Uncharacterized protein n=1 Tax=Ornithinimicrobium pekingense TaxID=384677 RepID=A0ABQ2F633_9MICO|nr:hypothetical protein [Ornithinimicrobium pekingense]GGK56746.1 hypothetical protein GCM10011509_01380 [Ornithinimicrobium pekingense]